MSDIALHIEYLITKHDCVIVPGFGAFIAQYASAFAFADSGMYKRPKRYVSFNSSINHSDGLLQNSLIRRHGISYEMANREVEDFVASLRKQLDYDGSVAIGRLGIFRKSEEVLTFEPCNISNACDDCFGLADLKIKTLEQLTEAEHPVEAETEIESGAKVIRLYSRRFIQVAASIAVLIAACFVLSTPLSFDKSTDYAGLDSAMKVKSATPMAVLPTSGDLAIALPEVASQETAKPVESEPAPTEEAKPVSVNDDDKPAVFDESLPHDENGNSYLIVSSLNTQQQAEKFIKGHKGDLRILERNGRYRVYIAQSNSTKELNKARRSIASQYPDAWIYR